MSDMSMVLRLNQNLIIKFLSPIITNVSFWLSIFLAPETDVMVQFLGPEIVIVVQFLVQIFISSVLANRKRKNNLNRVWIIDEFNRHKKNPFKHKYFPFYEFLGPETEL